MTYPFDEWYRKRRSGNWFPDIDSMIREMEKIMNEAFKHFEQPVPKKFKEHKLNDGSIVKEFGPIVYGYSIKIGEDGKPTIQKFGNIDAFSDQVSGTSKNTGEREPVIDILVGKEELKIVAEMPGVAKEDIKLYANENTLTLESPTSPDRLYHKKIDFSDPIDPTSGKSHYKNGILEIVFKKKIGTKGWKSILNKNRSTL